MGVTRLQGHFIRQPIRVIAEWGNLLMVVEAEGGFSVVSLQDQSAAAPGRSGEHGAEPGSPLQGDPDSTDNSRNCQYRDVGLGQVTTMLGTVL